MSGLGYIVGTNMGCSISKDAVNQSILIMGESGAGKSEAAEKIARQRAKTGKKTLLLDYGGAHKGMVLDDKNYFLIKVKEAGIPLPLFERFSSVDGGDEEEADVCEAVVDAFSQVAKLGYGGRYLLEKACQEAMMMRETYDDDMKCLYDAVSLLEEDEKRLLMAKFHNLFLRVKFHKKMDLWRPGKVSVVDFSGYPKSMQLILTQLVLSVLWRYYQIYGHQMEEGTMIMLDEFQNLPLKDGFVLTQILREGRKFNLSLLLATQTIFTFDVATRTILQQPGTKLYFRPVESELKKIAKQFPDIGVADAEKLLQNLKIGECLACGEFEIAGRSKLKTLKVSFREKWE